MALKSRLFEFLHFSFPKQLFSTKKKKIGNLIEWMQYHLSNNILLGCIIDQLDFYSAANIFSSVSILIPILLLAKQEVRWYPVTPRTF